MSTTPPPKPLVPREPQPDRFADRAFGVIRFTLPLLAALIVPGAAYLGATRALGAHPWWAVQTAWIGAALGLIIAFAAHRLPAKYSLIGLFALTGAGYAVAATGKGRFAASYAEDVFAGQMWYFGWIAAAMFAAALLATAAWHIRSGPR